MQVYATLSRVSFWRIPFTHYHILFHPCRQVPLKKGNSQMDSSVQDNPAASSMCQYGQFQVVPCTPSLKYQAATSQARLKSSWALPLVEDSHFWSESVLLLLGLSRVFTKFRRHGILYFFYPGIFISHNSKELCEISCHDIQQIPGNSQEFSRLFLPIIAFFFHTKGRPEALYSI